MVPAEYKWIIFFFNRIADIYFVFLRETSRIVKISLKKKKKIWRVGGRQFPPQNVYEIQKYIFLIDYILQERRLKINR